MRVQRSLRNALFGDVRNSRRDNLSTSGDGFVVALDGTTCVARCYRIPDTKHFHI